MDLTNTFKLSIFISIFVYSISFENIEEEKYGVRYATDCEVCKLVLKELYDQLNKKASSDVLELGYNIDSKNKKKTKYNKSELRLLEALEETCQGMMQYRIHKERTDSTRWAKSMSQTFQTLHGLVNKGVKVDLGIPYDLWDEPSAEVGHLRSQCEHFVEDNEELINDWYFGEQKDAPYSHICPLILDDPICLTESFGGIGPVTAEEQSTRKGDSAKIDTPKAEL